jgi:hypothetical protein
MEKDPYAPPGLQEPILKVLVKTYGFGLLGGNGGRTPGAVLA